jgi:DNA-binding NtrC family response regulator
MIRFDFFIKFATNVNKNRHIQDTMIKVLILDHSKSMRKTLGERLTYEGFSIEATDSVAEASELCRHRSFDIVLTDDSSQASPLGLPFIVLSHSSNDQLQHAVSAFRNGALDFLQIPTDINRLYDTLRQYSHTSEAPEPSGFSPHRTSVVRTKSTRTTTVQPIIGSSEAISAVRRVIDRIARFNTRTLIIGENGTGKELVAQWLHAKSDRINGPFVEVNCAAIPSELIESELFGHERGAFTSAIKQRKGKFEQASGGTLFMDEIGDMSLAAQAKVLRALQENKICRVGSDKDIDVDVRVIAATNKDLRREISEGNFREDLYHRLSVVIIRVPPLRERASDVVELTEHFMKQISAELHTPTKPIDAKAMESLRAMRWSGNVRELRNVIERLIILSGDCITAEDIKKYCLN